MKKRYGQNDFHRWTAALTALLLLFTAAFGTWHQECTAWAFGRSTEPDWYVRAYFTSTGSTGLLHLRYFRNMVYMQVDDLALAADMNVAYKNDTPVFTRTGSSFSYSAVKTHYYETYHGERYLPLRETAAQLYLRYAYDEEQELVIFHHTERLPDELIDLARFILGDDGGEHAFQRYNLHGVVGAYDTILPSVYNFLSGGFIENTLNLLTGDYVKDKYVECLEQILIRTDDNFTKELVGFLKKLNKGTDAYVSAVGDAAKTYTYLEKNGVDVYDQFGPYVFAFGVKMSRQDEVFQALDQVLLSPSRIIQLYNLVHLEDQSKLVYLRAFEYGLMKNSHLKETGGKDLEEAVKVIDTCLNNEVGLFGTTLWNALMDKAKKADEKFLKKLFTPEETMEFEDIVYGLTDSLAASALQLILDKVIKIEERTNAVEMTALLANVQDAAVMNIRDHYDNSDDYDPLAVKYSLILYLRACQCAYHMYELEPNLFEEFVGDTSYDLMNMMAKQAQEDLDHWIMEAASFDDDFITEIAYSEELDLGKAGFTATRDGKSDLLPNEHRVIGQALASAAGFAIFEGEETDAWMIDFNSDGYQDLVMQDDPSEVWMFDGLDSWKLSAGIRSTFGEAEPVIIRDIAGHSGAVLHERLGIRYKDGEGILRIRPFDGEMLDPVLEEIPAAVSPDGTKRWNVFESLCTDKEYRDLPPEMYFPGPEDYTHYSLYSFTQNVGDYSMEKMSDYLRTKTGVQEVLMQDLNGDGAEELIVHLSGTGYQLLTDGREEADYSASEEERRNRVWREQVGIIFLNNKEQLHVMIRSWNDILERYPRIADQAGQSSGTKKTLADGSHDMIFEYFLVDGDKDHGYTASIYEMKYYEFEERTLRALKAGDILHMGGDFGDVYIDSLQWYGDSVVQISFWNGSYTMSLSIGHYDDGTWKAFGDSDILYTYKGDSYELQIPPGAGMFLRYSDGRKERVGDLAELIAKQGQPQADLTVVIVNGQVQEIQREWWEWYN